MLSMIDEYDLQEFLDDEERNGKQEEETPAVVLPETKPECIEIHCKSDRCIPAGGRVSGGWELRGKLVSGTFGRVCSPGTLR